MIEQSTMGRVLAYRARGYTPERLAELFDVPLLAVLHMYEHASAKERREEIGARDRADAVPGGDSRVFESSQLPGAAAPGLFGEGR